MGTRYSYYGFSKDGNGKVICDATVSVFLTGTSTPASIYTASSGGVSVNSVTTGSDTSSSPGYFVCYVDRDDYAPAQEFDIVISKAGFTSKTFTNIKIFGLSELFVLTAQGDILYQDASGFQKLPAGTSGYFLKTQGAGANPAWTNTLPSTTNVAGLSGLLADDQHVLDAEVLAVAAPFGVTSYGAWYSANIEAHNDGTNPSTKMLMNADYLVLYNPSSKLTTTIVAPISDLPCVINTFAAGGRDQFAAYAASDDVWFYWIWGTVPGLNTINSKSAPTTGPTLPTGYTHYTPAFVIKIWAGPTINPTLPQGGSSIIRVCGNSVFYPNVPLLSGGSVYPTQDYDLSDWIPTLAGQSNIYVGVGIHSSGDGAVIGGAVALTVDGNFANLSLYPPVASSWASEDISIITVLPTDRQMSITFLSSSGTIDDCYGTVWIIGYTF